MRWPSRAGLGLVRRTPLAQGAILLLVAADAVAAAGEEGTGRKDEDGAKGQGVRCAWREASAQGPGGAGAP